MTKYRFRIRLPVDVPEEVLKKELARMMHELITQHGELHIDVGIRYKPSEYEIDTYWGLD